MGFFKKLGQASNFFKKADNAANNMFQKTRDALSKAADQTGAGIVGAGKQVGTGLRKVGNTLEKAAPIAGEVGAGLAMLAGQPEIAVPLMSASVSAQQLGSQAKGLGRQVKSTSVVAQNVIGQKANALDTHLAQAQSQLNQANAGLQSRLNAASSVNPSMTLPSNQLAAIHSELA